MTDEHQRELEAFEKNIMEAVRRREQERSQRQDRSQRQVPDPVSRNNERQKDRGENPLDLPARHRAENANRHEERLQTISDVSRRASTRENVDKYYEAWPRALKRAYAMRYDLSPRIYERRLADRKVDQRLISAADKEKIHGEAIREAVAVSQNRIRDINEALPAMIDKTIDDAARYSRGREDKAADAFRRLGGQQGRDKDEGRER